MPLVNRDVLRLQFPDLVTFLLLPSMVSQQEIQKLHMFFLPFSEHMSKPNNIIRCSTIGCKNAARRDDVVYGLVICEHSIIELLGKY